MEKFERFSGMDTDETVLGDFGTMLNAHSEAIEQHSRVNHGQDEAIVDLGCRLKDCEHLLRAHTDNHATAQAIPAGHTTLWIDRDGRLLTADEAVAIVVVAFEKEMTGDVHIDAWLERIRGRIISALRAHGRDR